MTSQLATTSLIDRANLDRDAVRREIARGLEGADDGELFPGIWPDRSADVRQWPIEAGDL
jgi:hypothetical protein